MFNKKFIGWIALVLFIIAAMTLVFLILLTFLSDMNINAQFILLIAGIFALAAAVTGFSALSTSPGKVGGVGGLALTIGIAFVLMFIVVARSERGTAQQPLATSITPPTRSATAIVLSPTITSVPTAALPAAFTKTYRNSIIGFELDYPSGWLIDTSNEASGTVILWSKKVEGPGVDGVPADVVKIDIVNPVTTARSLDELVEWQKQIIADSSHEILHERSVQLPSGLDAVQLHISGIGEAMALLTMINETPLIIVEYGDLSYFTEVSQSLRAIWITSWIPPAVDMLFPYDGGIVLTK